MSTNKKKLSVLLLSFIFSPNVGGVETHLDELCTYLTEHDVKITVITYKPIIGKTSAPFFQKKKNLVIYRIPWIRWNLFNRLISHPVLQMLYLIPAIFVFTFFYLLTKNKNVDVIQSHGFNMAMTAYLLSSIFRKPFTVNTHVSFSFKQKNFYTKVLGHVLNHASKVLVLTEDAKQELINIGVSQAKIVVYHYWVDRSFLPLDKAKARQTLHLPDRKFIVLFVGRFIKEKGVLLLLKAFQSIHDDMQLIMIGSGPLEDEIHKICNGNKKVEILTAVERKDFPKWYSAADVTVIPSFNATPTYSEGIPRVMIESLSCGTPVIATKAGGLKTLLVKDVGYFIKPDSHEIAKTLRLLIKKKKQLILMRKSAIMYTKKTFSITQNANKIVESLYTT